MPVTRIKVEGLKELDAALVELGQRTAKKIVRAALKKAAVPVKEEAVKRARRAIAGPTYPVPYDPTGPREGGARGPGHMAESIAAVVSISKRFGAVAKIGVDAAHWYAAFQEFGTPQSPPESFLRASLEEKQGPVLTILKSELGRRIEKEAVKLAKSQRRKSEAAA